MIWLIFADFIFLLKLKPEEEPTEQSALVAPSSGHQSKQGEGWQQSQGQEEATSQSKSEPPTPSVVFDHYHTSSY